MKAVHEQEVSRNLRRWVAYLVGALVVVSLIALWMSSSAPALAPAETDGDSDLGWLAHLLFIANSVGALVVYGLAMSVVERVIRRRDLTEAVGRTFPDGALRSFVHGAVLGFAFAISAGTSIDDAGLWIPPVLVALVGVGVGFVPRFRAIGFAWTLGVASSTMVGWYLSVLASLAVGD